MTSTRSRLARSRLVRAGAVVGVTALLAGCGAARPGVAAQVGDETISVSEVDDATSAYCEALAEASPGTMVPMGYARSFLLNSLIDRTAGEQIAAEYAVEPGADYASAVADLDDQIGTLPEEQQEAVVILQMSTPYRQAVTAAAARKLLAQEGVVDPTDEQLQRRAGVLTSQWNEGNPTDIDPRFGRLGQDGYEPGESLAFAVSQAAEDGDVTDQAELAGIAEGLPVSQRCGA